MALTAQEREEVAKSLANKWYRVDGRTAVMDKTELVAGVTEMDGALDSLISTHTGTDTILQAINKELTEPFVSIATNQDKSETLAAVTAKRTGLT